MEANITQLVVLSVAIILPGLWLFHTYKQKYYESKPTLPPGPKRMPIIGNLLDLPSSYNWIHWSKHKDIYGPISSLSIMGQIIIIVNDYSTTVQLLDKRSNIYSDRLMSPFMQLVGWGMSTTLLMYGNDHLLHRKYVHQFLGTKAAVSLLHPGIELETRRLLLRLFNNRVKVQDNIRLYAGTNVLKLSHGYTVDTESVDPLIYIGEKTSRAFCLSLQSGKWLVDSFPVLRYVPSWMPGAEFKRLAESWKKVVIDHVDIPFEYVKQRMVKASGSAEDSIVSYFLAQNPTPEEEQLIKHAAATLYAAAADTSVSIISSFFIIMQLYPDVQKRAQAEIDAEIGGDRLPVFADRQNLPYVDAVAKELIRYHPTLPLGIPHVATQDDIYEGYFIPTGSVIISNAWAITRDPDNYHEPDVFNPDRFLGTNGRPPELDPNQVIYGYGRRICPGKLLADATIFISIAMFFAVFNVTKGKVQNGKDIHPVYEMTDGVLCHPKPFKCTITPRSQKAKDLVLAVAEENVDHKSDAAAIADAVAHCLSAGIEL